MSIRLATIIDAQQIREIYAPYVENTTISFETTVPSLEEMENRVRGSLEKYAWLVLEEGPEILGYAYASKHRERAAYRWSVDVSVYVKENNHRKGIGGALYKALFTIIRTEGYHNAYAAISLPNDPSVRLHEYLGFKQIAHFNKVGYKMGQWLDVGWWELILQEHHAAPIEPVSLHTIKNPLLP